MKFLSFFALNIFKFIKFQKSLTKNIPINELSLSQTKSQNRCKTPLFIFANTRNLTALLILTYLKNVN